MQFVEGYVCDSDRLGQLFAIPCIGDLGGEGVFTLFGIEIGEIAFTSLDLSIAAETVKLVASTGYLTAKITKVGGKARRPKLSAASVPSSKLPLV